MSKASAVTPRVLRGIVHRTIAALRRTPPLPDGTSELVADSRVVAVISGVDGQDWTATVEAEGQLTPLGVFDNSQTARASVEAFHTGTWRNR